MLNSRGCILTPLAVILYGEESEIKISISVPQCILFLWSKLRLNYVKYQNASLCQIYGYYNRCVWFVWIMLLINCQGLVQVQLHCFN